VRGKIATGGNTRESPHRRYAASGSDIRELLGEQAIVGSDCVRVVSIASNQVPTRSDAVADPGDVGTGRSHDPVELAVGVTGFGRALLPPINSPKQIITHISIEKFGDGRAFRDETDLPELHPGNVADRRRSVRTK